MVKLTRQLDEEVQKRDQVSAESQQLERRLQDVSTSWRSRRWCGVMVFERRCTLFCRVRSTSYFRNNIVGWFFFILQFYGYWCTICSVKCCKFKWKKPLILSSINLFEGLTENWSNKINKAPLSPIAITHEVIWSPSGLNQRNGRGCTNISFRRHAKWWTSFTRTWQPGLGALFGIDELPGFFVVTLHYVNQHIITMSIHLVSI